MDSNSVLQYVLKMVTLSAVLYGYFFFFLKDRKHHVFSRFYLLSAVVISLALPLVEIPVDVATAEMVFPAVFSNEFKIFAEGSPAVAAADSNYIVILVWLIYFATSALLLMRIILSIIKILHNKNRCSVQMIGDVNVHVTDDHGAPYSFFRWLFWRSGLDASSLQGGQVLRHEQYHMRQFHTIDLLFVQIVIAFAWINPFYWLMRSELMLVHEYAADEYALDGNAPQSYAGYLLNHSLQISLAEPVVAHSFFHSPLKRRIMMLFKSNSSVGHTFTAKVAVVPMLALLVAIFAFTAPPVADFGSRKSLVRNLGDTAAIKSLQHHLIRQLRYPQKAKDLNVGTTMHYKLTVDANGNFSSLQKINAIPAGVVSQTIIVAAYATEGGKAFHESTALNGNFDQAVKAAVTSYAYYQQRPSDRSGHPVYISFHFRLEDKT